MTDIVIATVPYIEFYLPPAGPAALKGHLESNGISCDTMDLNISLKKNFTDKTELNEVISFLTTEEYTIKSKSVQHKVDTMVNNWCKELLSTNPTWIGLSVFSRDSLKSCELTVKKMKELKTKLEEKLMNMPQKSVEELLKQSEMLFPKKGKI